MDNDTVSLLGFLAFAHALLALAIAADDRDQDREHATARVNRMLMAESALLSAVVLAVLVAVHLHVGWS